MAKVMKIHEVLNLLETGDFEKLIGVMESEVLEFKGAPYQLDTTKLKLELAKDVSALANVGGGIIIMGIKTCIEEDHPHEVAEQIRNFPEAVIEIKQFENVIDEWIYPRINLEIRWVPSIMDDNKGIAYISVPESETGRKPFLTVTVLQEDDKNLGNVVGFFQRKGDKVIHWSTEELYHTFKDGLRIDEYLSEIKMAKQVVITTDNFLPEIFKSIPSTVSQINTVATEGETSDNVNKKVESAIDAAGLKDSISYILVSSPDMKFEISGLFESRTSEVVKQIDYPHELRHAGFDISTEERSKIVNGELRRSLVKPYKLLEVWRDGTVIFIADGESFLCWGGDKKKDFLRINTIALVESSYLFTLFVKNVFEAAQAPDINVQMQLHVSNIPKDMKYGLPKGKPGSMSWQFNFERDLAFAPKINVIATKSWTWKKAAPEKAAYELVSELYAKFGVEHEFIPYVKECEGEKVIDIEGIKSLG